MDADRALTLIEERLGDGRGGYVCFSNVHTVVTGRRDVDFRAITNASWLSLADGKPVYWVARTKGPAGHVPGPDFMALVHWIDTEITGISCTDRRIAVSGPTRDQASRVVSRESISAAYSRHRFGH